MFISRLTSPAAVATEAGVSPERLAQLVEAKPRLFTEIRMKKRRPGAGDRVVYEVHEHLSPVHRAIALWVRASWTPPTCVHGFRKGRSIVTHAKPHCGKHVVVTADIMDFFPSISDSQVREAFLAIGAQEVIAELLTELCTLDGFLPAGTRSSPEIANLVCRRLDGEFMANFPSYSRYADDLAFSGTPSDVPSQEQVADTLLRHRFSLRIGSYFAVAHPRHRYVTGLLVDHAHGPHVAKETKRALRAEAHYIAKFGLRDHCRRTGRHDPEERLVHIRGKLNQIAMIEPMFARPLLASLPRLRPQDLTSSAGDEDAESDQD
jgi:RNA-directed DNA polymerase